ncbi:MULTISPECIES: ribosome small subunit-dependent GTPase A [Halocynthiibacter]|uniref:Small ribosomal subunit biogenesis GTPase RsgA n=1 Tax=Halocynthiibacter halioticoli TaxID=2986804 RepID=A0AAE3IW73_9RHOB|nr:MULTISPECIES: ribosome small subunit-dependent GTPase A [Halocynthiibacter]MCV6823327.1 ribosome small subunit-dependent GTPase A [Halocynthiibacter halioticoli]MCW4056328.1 ribosome small subunit-dependent GTPase A [Halocynthiibacter sp. SDUM655004]
MSEENTLSDLGWSHHFQSQLTDEDAGARPMRVSEVHRSSLTALDADGAHFIVFSAQITSGDVAVGDWILVEADADRIIRVLDRKSHLSRRAAGPELREQLVAANVDTLFIVTSCNADFNEARLERFISMAFEANATPIIVITKADQTDDNGADYVRRAEKLSLGQVAIPINAKDPADLERLMSWCGPKETIALLGSSGVGKTTITNGIAGTSEATSDIREDDAKGRHTTTARSLHRIDGGGWLVDTPGMREFGLFEAADGINAVFQDVLEFAENCKFRDCAHESEPGCAVRAAIERGELDADRLERWRKLQREDAHQSETIAQSRKRGKDFARMVKDVKKVKHRKYRGD